MRVPSLISLNLKQIVVMISLIMLILQPFMLNLSYVSVSFWRDSPALFSAQVYPFWGWFTGHFVHIGIKHYVLNALVLILLPWLFDRLPQKLFFGQLLLLPLLLSICFLLFFKKLNAYVGLSGVLHGLYAGACLYSMIQMNKYIKNSIKESLFYLVIFILIWIKIIAEQFTSQQVTADFIGASVFTSAHALGAVFGITISLGYLVAERVHQKKTLHKI